MAVTDPRRALPGVDRLLTSGPFRDLLARHPRGRVVAATRQVLEAFRRELAEEPGPVPDAESEEYACRVGDALAQRSRPSLRPVLNATGVVLHTNLGRAPLSGAAREAMGRAGEGYSNLEFDISKGERGSRYDHCVELLREITGADDALVVNNNAAAVILALNTLALGRDVLVSRGELVEIGGGFRIPDMISRSGGILKEVGTTNRTRVADYRAAAEDGNAGAILKVHRSNFEMTGFTEEASVEDLGKLAADLGLHLFHDLGSGLLADPEAIGLPPEPSAPQSLLRGAHAVAISGDKLLGGPQAGIILGSREIIARMRRNPLTRAFRVDKVTLAGLEATLRHYLDPEEALREIPTLRMLAATPDSLRERAEAFAGRLGGIGIDTEVAPGEGRVGGGTYPNVGLPGWVVRVRVPGISTEALAQALRCGEPPVVGRREEDDLVLDLRTVDSGDEEALFGAFLAFSFAEGPQGGLD